MIVRASEVILAILFLSIFSQSQEIPTPRTAGTLLSTPELTSFSVTVLTSKGTPAQNARVELRDLSTGQAVSSGYTNYAGQLELSNVANTTYVLEVTQGLSEFKERADMRMGDRNMVVRLPSTDYPDAGNAGTDSSVSVAQFKVSGKARDEYKKAMDCLKKHKKEETAQHLEKALQIFPDYSEALTLRAVLKMDKEDADGALADLDAAIKIDPAYATAYFAQGATYNGLSRFDDAIRALDRGLSFSPNSWQAYFELGKAQLGKGNYQIAIKNLDKAQQLVSESYAPIHLVRAHALLGLQQYPDAMNEFQLFLTEAPDDARSAEARQKLEQVKAFAAGK
jgi:tetratricopeptide (TPR) repeat protein